MLKSKSETFHVEANTAIVIECDRNVVLYGLLNKKRTSIIGTGEKIFFSTIEATDFELITEGLWSIQTRLLPKNTETLDPTPMEIPIEFKTNSLRDEMREYIRQMVSQEAITKGQGSFEEEDDFDIEDDEMPYSPYEEREMIPEYLNEPAPADSSNTTGAETEASLPPEPPPPPEVAETATQEVLPTPP